jgi:hypothetical protein
VRLVVARCEVTYTGRLTAYLPEAIRLLVFKADGSVLVHADSGGYKPLNCGLTHRGPGRIYPRPVRRRCPLPSAFMTKISSLPPWRSLTKEICRPSGDQERP